jgi:hypothetical protein
LCNSGAVYSFYGLLMMWACFWLAYSSWITASLSFTSWTCSWLQLVLLLLRWLAGSSPELDLELQLVSKVFAGDVCVLQCKNRGVLVFAQCWSSESLAPLGAPHLVDCLVLLAAVVLPAQGLHAMTKLLELLVTRA